MALKCKYIAVVRILAALSVFPVLLFSGGCRVSYSFTGASISPQVRTLSVQYFQNRASLVQPVLSQTLTDALIDKCRAQTKLSLINGFGDVNFEGEITDYNTRPLTVAANSRAAMNRFTISVKVKFTNIVEPQYNYEKTFSRYEDYDSRFNLSDVEEELSKKIIALLVEDIFNEAFVNW
ncbi:MAG: LPS assembly lipoprotein LptE [Bacteroidales bacterium]